METDKLPTFLLGAGFNLDANTEGDIVEGARYPVVNDLAKICFDLSCPPEDKSIEDLFHEADRKSDSEPMRRLADHLMAADYYSARRLIPYFGAKKNCYSRFFDHFGKSQFLTLNYDSLAELFLLRSANWFPGDGYGIFMDVDTHPTVKIPEVRPSASLVLHLHGSLCIYASEFIIDGYLTEGNAILKERGKPRFFFDPGEISSLFHPYSRMPSNHDWMPSGYRVVAPLPDKAEGLREEFIREVYGRANQVLTSSTAPLVVIGYSFGRHDSDSYTPLLKALELGSASVLLVSPDAKYVQERISREFPRIRFEPMGRTFKSWADADFPGLR